MRKVLAITLALILALSTFSVFADPKAEEKEILYVNAGTILKSDGVITGTEKGLEPMNSLTREQAVAIVVRMNGWDKEFSNFQPIGMFRDVPAHHWAAKYVEIAQLKGLTNGIGDGKFGLGLKVTKKEFLSYMLRTLEYTADWEKENIMEKAKKLGISGDSISEEKVQMVRGQSFVYMLNTLVRAKNGKGKALYAELGLRNSYYKNNDKAPDVPNKDKDNDKDKDKGENTKKKLTRETLDYSVYPKPIAASTPTFDELKVEFNTLISNPKKENFVFTVSDGRTIRDEDYSIAPGGKEIIFRFKSQNLHGKTLTCTMKGLESGQGKKMLGEGKITAAYKEFTPIYFTNSRIMSKKQYEAFLSIAVKPGNHPYGYSVSVDGRELTEKVDYDMSWGGKRFAPIFKHEAAYPKRTSTLTIWGWVTAPYEKFLDEPISITVDFEAEANMDYDAPPVREAEDPVVDFIIDNVAVDQELEELNKHIDEDCTAPYIVSHEQLRGEIQFNTKSVVKEIKGLRLRDIAGKEYPCKYEADPDKPEFKVSIINLVSYSKIDALLADNIICKKCGAETGPIEYKLHKDTVTDNNGPKEKASFIIAWEKVNEDGDYFFKTESKVGEIKNLTIVDSSNKSHQFDYKILNDRRGFIVHTKNKASIIFGHVMADNIISKKDKVETGPIDFRIQSEIN